MNAPLRNGRAVEVIKTWLAIGSAVVALGSLAYSAGYQGAQVTAQAARIEKLEAEAALIGRLEERVNAAIQLLEDLRRRDR